MFQHFEEIPADGLYCVDLMNKTSEQDSKKPFRINKFEWRSTDTDLKNPLLLTCPILPFNKQMPCEQDFKVIAETRWRIFPPKKETLEENFTGEHNKMATEESGVREDKTRAVENEFSWLDIAENITRLNNMKIKDRIDGKLNCEPERCENEALDDYACSGLNTESTSPDRMLSGNATLNVSKIQPCHDSRSLSTLNFDSKNSRHSFWETICHGLTQNEPSDNKNIPQASCRSSIFSTQWNSSFEQSRDKFIDVLGEAVRKRVFNLPRTNSVSPEQGFAFPGAKKENARVGILFSGGIDSMMIAALADK